MINKPLQFLRKPELVFVVLASIFGLIFTFATPLFRVPDERPHFLRAYQVSTLHFLPEKNEVGIGGTLPRSIIDLQQNLREGIDNHGKNNFWEIYKRGLALNLDPKDKKTADFSNVAIYSPIVYSPQAIGMDLARALGSGPMLMMYSARLANLAFWILAVYLAIRVAPFGKWAFAALALTPVAMQQAASVSADVVTNALCFFFLALIMKLAIEKTGPNFKQWVYIIVVSILLGLSKLPFFLLVSLLPLVCIKKSQKGLAVKYILAFAVATSFALVWSGAMQHYFTPARTDVITSPSLQAAFIEHHPLKYISAFIHTYLSDWGDSYLIGLVGNLGFLDVPLHLYIVISSYLILFWALFTGGVAAKEIFSIKQKIWVAAVTLLMTGAISTLLYLSWSPIGANRIDGIQGRYFIALTPLLIPLLANREINLKNKLMSTAFVVSVGSGIILILAISHIVNHYYI